MPEEIPNSVEGETVIKGEEKKSGFVGLMSKYRKGFAPLIVIIVVLVILATAGILLLGKTSQQSSTQTAISNPTASTAHENLTTEAGYFTSKKYGYKFKVPDGFTAKENDSGLIIVSRTGKDFEEVIISSSNDSIESLSTNLKLGECLPLDVIFENRPARSFCDKVKNSIQFTSDTGLVGIKNTLEVIVTQSANIVATRDETVVILDVSKSTNETKSLIIETHSSKAPSDMSNLLSIVNSLKF